MKGETKESILMYLMFALVTIVMGELIFAFGIMPMLEENTKIGTITRVELLAGHIGSTMDKCIVAFDDGTTVILESHAFAKANKYVGKNIVMVYLEYGQIISIKEVTR